VTARAAVELDPMPTGTRIGSACLAVVVACLVMLPSLPAFAQSGTVVQTAEVAEKYGYLNLSAGGGGPSGVDGDGAPALQKASMTATFSNFTLNGIGFSAWSACRATQSVDECLAALVADRDGDGVKSLRDLHPGAIGGDVLAFDLTITNTSPSGGPVLTTFAFQSKFSESPALGSRIGDKLFSAQRVPLLTGEEFISNADNPLIGVKKNGTTNGLFPGKIKGICINSSDDYPSDLNLGVENETLECAGGRTYDRTIDWVVLQAPDGSLITTSNIKLPKGLLPGESMTMRLELDAGTDDGALQRAYSPDCDLLEGDAQVACKAAVGPLVGTLLNQGLAVEADEAAKCLELNIQPGDNVLDVVNYGDVKIIRNSAGECVPSFDPFSKNQFLTIPRRNWAFTDILDTRDDYLPAENPTPGHTVKFSFLDFGHLKSGEMNFFEIMRGFGEHDKNGYALDPSCLDGGSRAGSCGGDPYVPWAEFYAIANGTLVRQEVVGTYGTASYGSGGPTLTATVAVPDGQTTCRGPGATVKCKTTNPFEVPGESSAGAGIGASALATFTDIEVIGDNKATIANEGGQAGGDKLRFTVTIQNTSPPGSDIYLTSFNIQTKQRGLTDINVLDGTSIQGRQDLRTGADGTLPACTTSDDPDYDPFQARCFDTELGIGRFPNVIGNSLLSSTFVFDYGQPLGPVAGKLEAIKKNGTFQPLTKTDFGVANFICIKSGPPSEDQDADETCAGEAGKGLAPGETQSVRIEMDYGDFRGLILRVAPGTLKNYTSPADDPFGLLALRGDFDCRDQRRLPYCHPDLVGQDWFTSPAKIDATTGGLADVEFVTVHQPGDAATVMNFQQNFGKILAMAGFMPTAEFYQGGTQMAVKGAYLDLPGSGGAVQTLSVAIASPLEGALVNGTVEITASSFGTVTASQVEFFVNGASLAVDTEGSDGWSTAWNTEAGPDGVYQLTAVATNGTLTATSSVRTVTVANALTVQIAQPTANSTIAGLTTLIAHTAGLNAATGVTFAYSGGTIGAATQTSAGVWELAWDASGVAAGDYELTATATNGTEMVSHTIAIEIVTLKITIVAPDAGAILFGTVRLAAEVVSAAPVTGVEFVYQASGAPMPVSIGTATLNAESGLWELDWISTGVGDTPLTKPATLDRLSAVVTADGSTAGDAIDIRISNMLTARIFLPDNQEDLRGFEDFEVLVTSESPTTSVRFDLYSIDDLDPAIFIPFGEASVNGEPIEDRKYGRPLGNPEWPTGAPLYPVGDAFAEGATRWVLRNWDTRTVPDGTYGLVATATDEAGRTATYMIETYIVNDLRVVITAPDDGASVSRFVALEARTSSLTGADNAAPGSLWPATSVVFTVGGVNIVATEVPEGSGRWRAVWNADALAPGPYTITATATNANPDGAEVATDFVSVNLVAPGAELLAFFPFDWSYCWLYECAFLDGSSGGPTSWLWEFGDGNSSTEQLPKHTYSTWGVYTVTLTVGNGTTSHSYSRVIAVGNVGTVGFNTNPVNDPATEFINWTSAFKNFDYTVGDVLAVPVMWKTTAGTSEFAALPDVVLFTPEEADGTPPELVGAVENGVLFTMTFTDVQYRGVVDEFKGKVNLRVEVNVDLDEDGTTDWEARLGTNVDVTNTGFDGGDNIVAITSPAQNEVVSGDVTIEAATVSSVTADQIEFFVDGASIGVDTDGSDGWSALWSTIGLVDGSTHSLTAVATSATFVTTSAVRTVTVNNSGMPAPTVTLTANLMIVASGGSSVLEWSSTNAASCEASGGWSGSRATSGNESTGPLTTSTTYTLTCTGAGGSAVASVSVAVEPTVTLTASPMTIDEGQTSLLEWSSTNTTSCDGSWSSPVATSGSVSVSPTSTTTYTLSCIGEGGSASASVTVTVNPVVTGPTFSGSSSGQRNTWSATVTVSGAPANTSISGSWNIGGTPSSCTTNGSGTCTITRSGIARNVSSVTWTHTVSGQMVTITKP
jgi:PKD repeat protein